MSKAASIRVGEAIGSIDDSRQAPRACRSRRGIATPVATAGTTGPRESERKRDPLRSNGRVRGTVQESNARLIIWIEAGRWNTEYLGVNAGPHCNVAKSCVIRYHMTSFMVT